MRLNPFANKRVREEASDTQASEIPDRPVPQHGAYAAPAIETGDAFITEFGWSPRSLRPSTVETPSAQRLGTIPRFDVRPDPEKPAERWWERKDADDKQRHSVEYQDADGWQESKGIVAGQSRFADDPRWTPVAEPRMTSSMAPTTYQFMRPFDQHAARRLSGEHFSMADHRRDYEILGMAPVRNSRNTYRIEPTPWDADIVDSAPVAPVTHARIIDTETSPYGRAWRL